MSKPTHPLKLWALARGVDLADLAEQLGLSPSQLSHILAYRRRPSLELIAAATKLTEGQVDARAWWNVTDSWHADVGNHWRDVRELLELRAQDVAGRAGLPINTYKLIESGARRPTLEQLFKISRALGTLPSKALAAAGA